MTLMVNQFIGFGAGGNTLDATIFKIDDSNVSATATASHTHTAVTLSASGQTIIGVHMLPNAGLGTMTLTANGVAATEIVTAASANERTSIFIVGAGASTGDVVITGSSTLFTTQIVVWEMLNGSATATDSGSDTNSDPATFDLDIAAGGIAVGMLGHRSDTDPTTYTWTNLTEVFDAAVNSNTQFGSAASAAFATAQTNLTITADASAAGVRSPVLCVASFPKAA